MSSPLTNQDNTSTITTTVRDQTCLKMASLTNPSSATSSSSPIAAASLVNSHCSMGQQAGNSGLAPIMEIREMNSYCNSCVGADKYWNHHHHPHHHHGTPPLVPSNVVRHPVVYPQMYFTPPPPPPPSANYSGSSGTGASHDWTCPPSANADSYSHFIYSQYPPPPQHDYSNYLSISSGWPTAESDMMMMGAAGPTQLSSTGNGCEPSVVVPPTQSMINSFMYPNSLPPPPPPPQSVQVSSYESHMNSALSSSSNVHQRKPEKTPKPESFNRPLLSSASSTVGDSTSDDSDEDTEDEEDSRHIISIEDDDDNGSIVEEDDDISLSAVDTSSPLCLLCKKSAFMNVLSQSAPSPQLSRILENIDDDELDISVCSGDIEIGGIEDEMIQQATEQQHCISVQRLSQLVGVSVSELLIQENFDQRLQLNRLNEEQDAPLCSKCQKLVGMAESLEKQLNSVLCTIRQQVQIETVIEEGQGILQKLPMSHSNSVAVQTDFNITENPQAFIVVSKTNELTYSIRLSDPSAQLSNNHDNDPPYPSGNHPSNNYNIPMPLGPYLCHECGRTFNIRRNLGKHLKRQHYESWQSSSERSSRLLTCDRENCGKTCFDKAALQIHSRKHTSEKPFFCTKCLKLFTTKSNLTAHKKSNICEVESISKKIHSSEDDDEDDDTLENHSPSSLTISQSTNPVVFRCENCGLTFRTEARFHRHIKTSCNRNKIFQCDICLKPFAKRSELQAHLVVHTGAKSFPCDICGLTFSTKGNQRVHQRTHLTDKRFKCQQCDKGFTRNQTLQVHIANAHKKL